MTRLCNEKTNTIKQELARERKKREDDEETRKMSLTNKFNH